MLPRMIALVILAALTLTLGLAPASALAVATKAPPSDQPASLLRLFYYMDGPNARASFMQHSDLVDVLAPQSYSVDAAGDLSGSIDPTLRAFAQDQKIRVMPLVVNAGFSSSTAQAFLADIARQDLAIESLVDEAQRYGYWGWQFDFEQMDVSLRPAYSEFIARAAIALKANNLASSVAVMAHVSDDPADYPNNLWQRILGVYDYRSLASSTDFISVMSYDDPTSQGPVAGYQWLKDVISYSLAYVPSTKLSLGIPFYYWQWQDETGKRVGIGGNVGMQNLLARHDTTYHYSAEEQAPYLTYWSRSKSYTVWYENGQSVAKKISLITANGLSGFSAWALGLEVPSVYAAMKR